VSYKIGYILQTKINRPSIVQRVVLCSHSIDRDKESVMTVQEKRAAEITRFSFTHEIVVCDPVSIMDSNKTLDDTLLACWDNVHS